MDKVSLFEELRLIERSENEVNGAWKGGEDAFKTCAHLLLFFLAFVFGSFCTFCFHMLMYLFDEKCVLFPKLLSLTSLRYNVIYEFIPEDKDKSDMLPVDFLSTQWLEKSACYLPTYVPLVSGIFGLIWTSMFLMSSTGSRNLTGLQRPWRVIPPVFVFSLAMSGLCIYSSVMTHYGLQELCVKLGEITGSSTCSYTVNVATLVYERRIRGVFQATRLTIISSWLHTGCWLLSALLALVRILLAVDFQLVLVKVELQGDINKMLEKHEKQLRTISPGRDNENDSNFSSSPTQSSTEIHFRKQTFTNDSEDLTGLIEESDVFLFTRDEPVDTSEMSLVPEERHRLARLLAYESVPKERQFIVKIVYDLFDDLELADTPTESPSVSLGSFSSMELPSKTTALVRQYGQSTISLKAPVLKKSDKKTIESVNLEEAEQVAKEIKQKLHEGLYRQLVELPIHSDIASDTASPGTSKKRGHIAFESSMNITSEMRRTLEDKLKQRFESEGHEEKRTDVHKKSNLKTTAVQTDKKSKATQKVTISESKSKDIGSSNSSFDSNAGDDKDTQTEPKEKQD